MEDLGGSSYNKYSAGGNTSTVFSVSGGFGALTFGNTDGAADKNTTETHRVYRDIDYELWGDRVDNKDSGEILRYDYKFGSTQVSLSYAGATGVKRTGVGVSWSGDMGGNKVALGFGYEDGDDLKDFISLSAGIDFAGGLGLRTTYWQADDAAGTQTLDNTDVSVQYSMNSLTVGASYHMDDIANSDNYHVFAKYNLGGGAMAFIQTGTTGTTETTVSSAGVSFNF